MIRSSSAKAKGRLLERQLVDALRQSGIDPKAYRVAGSGAGLDKSDCYAPTIGWVFEAKNQKTSSPLKWMKQMEGDQKTKVGANGAVVWSPSYASFEDSIVMLRWRAFADLLKAAKEPAAIDPADNETKYLLSQLKNAAQKLLKKLA